MPRSRGHQDHPLRNNVMTPSEDSEFTGQDISSLRPDAPGTRRERSPKRALRVLGAQTTGRTNASLSPHSSAASWRIRRIDEPR